MKYKLTHTFAQKVEEHLGCVEGSLQKYAELEEMLAQNKGDITSPERDLLRKMAILGEMLRDAPQKRAKLRKDSIDNNAGALCYLVPLILYAAWTRDNVIFTTDWKPHIANFFIALNLGNELLFTMGEQAELRKRLNYLSDEIVDKLPNEVFPNGAKPMHREGYSLNNPPKI